MATTKYIFFNSPAVVGSSFTAPADFGSLVSLEALGYGGNGATSTATANRYAGGGGGGYSKTLGSSVTVPIVAGVTTIYYTVGSPSLGTGFGSFINISSLGLPTSKTEGVYASFGQSGSQATGGTGASTPGVTFDVQFGGGTGGAGSNSSRNNAGGGGGAGSPAGAGSNGGNAWNTNANRGHGGGGGTGGGGSSGSGTSSAGGSGATGGNGSASGGSGGTSGSPNGTAGGTGGDGAGGGGGGYGATGLSSSANNGGLYVLYSNATTGVGDVTIGGGPGGGFNGTPGPGAGGAGTSGSGAGGGGWVLFTYLTADPVTSNGNFLAFF
jgi:hypothetical protein